MGFAAVWFLLLGAVMAKSSPASDRDKILVLARTHKKS
jgi:hypothetical protein